MEKNNSKRLFLPDVFRGVAVVIMMIFDSTLSEGYEQLKHAAWEGITFADFAFPAFVCAMGISAAISISRHSVSVQKIFRRSAILFMLGIFFNVLPHILEYFLGQEFSGTGFFSRSIEHGRLFGILQRLALTYFLGMCLIKFLKSDKKIFSSAFIILILYSLGFHLYSAENSFLEGKNIFDATDLFLIGSEHLYTPQHDPEGLYGTFASTAEFLLSFLAGKIFLKNISLREKNYLFVFGGIFFLIAGSLWSLIDIVSKNLWTAPYVLLTVGIEIIFFAGLMNLFDSVPMTKKIFRPFQALGKNPLFFFFASNLGLMILFTLRIDGKDCWRFIFENTFKDFINPAFGSLTLSLVWCGIWIFIAEVFDRKNIIFHVGSSVKNQDK